jgi:hypothetical protein
MSKKRENVNGWDIGLILLIFQIDMKGMVD